MNDNYHLFETNELFNEFGNYDKVILGDSSIDIYGGIPNPYDITVASETSSIHSFGQLRHLQQYTLGKSITGMTNGEVIFNYSSKGLISNIKHKHITHDFYYNDQDQLIRIIRQSNFIAGSHKILYSWDDNKLVSKKVFDNEDNLIYSITINYEMSKKTFVKKGEYGFIRQRIIQELDKKKRVVKETVENLPNNNLNKGVESYTINEYSYDENNLIKKVYVKNFKKANSRLSAGINAFYGKPVLYENGEYYIGPFETVVDVKRDKNRMLLGTKANVLYKTNENKNSYRHGVFGVWTKRWQFKYDKKGNWTERKEYEILDGDETLKNMNYLITRNITYYE